MIVPALGSCTRVPGPEIDEMAEAMKAGDNPRDFKLRLAFEITKAFLGEKAAKKGQDHFATVIQGKDKPEDIPEMKLKATDIVSALVEAKLCKSKSEARRNIDGGGVRVNDTKIEAYDHKVKSGDLIQKGKRHFVRVK